MKIIGEKINVSDLKKNDMFYMDYGFNVLKFRVQVSCDGFVLAHSLGWLRSSAIKIDGRRELRYAGRMSKLRSIFLL